eukprot:gene4647-5088_t
MAWISRLSRCEVKPVGGEVWFAFRRVALPGFPSHRTHRKNSSTHKRLLAKEEKKRRETTKASASSEANNEVKKSKSSSEKNKSELPPVDDDDATHPAAVASSSIDDKNNQEEKKSKKKDKKRSKEEGEEETHSAPSDEEGVVKEKKKAKVDWFAVQALEEEVKAKKEEESVNEDEMTVEEKEEVALPVSGANEVPFGGKREVIPVAYHRRCEEARRRLRADPSIITSHTVMIIDMSGSMEEYIAESLPPINSGLFSRANGHAFTDVATVLEMRDSRETKIRCEPISWELYNDLVDVAGEGGARRHGNYLPAFRAAFEVLSRYAHAQCALSLFFFFDEKPSDFSTSLYGGRFFLDDLRRLVSNTQMQWASP